jgi:hypothetical protein
MTATGFACGRAAPSSSANGWEQNLEAHSVSSYQANYATVHTH